MNTKWDKKGPVYGKKLVWVAIAGAWVRQGRNRGQVSNHKRPFRGGAPLRINLIGQRNRHGEISNLPRGRGPRSEARQKNTK